MVKAKTRREKLLRFKTFWRLYLKLAKMQSECNEKLNATTDYCQSLQLRAKYNAFNRQLGELDAELVAYNTEFPWLRLGERTLKLPFVKRVL